MTRGWTSRGAALRNLGRGVVRPIVASYVNTMSERETIRGAPIAEKQIAAWAAEAEAGYDVAALKKRGRGRSGRGAEPPQLVALRLTIEEIAAIDARAEREGSRAQR